MSVTCNVVVGDDKTGREYTFLSVPRAGEEVDLPTPEGSSSFRVEKVSHFAEGAASKSGAPAIVISVKPV